MSRCFPFPPPGYGKKARTDDADILTKEKLKEKKHKKEKKDKEKKEGKEKKNKEKSKDKHREKKDRKEKHKDKKDKEKDKDKHKTFGDKRNEGRPEGHNAETLGQNIQCAEEIKDSKFVQELGRRIRYEDKGTGNQMVENFTGTDHRKAEFMCRLVEKGMENSVQGKENNKDKKSDDRRADGQRNKDEEKGMGNAMLQSSTKMDQRTAEKTARPMEKDTEKRMEGKEKNKDKENRRKDKHKEKDREKKGKGKDKNRDKEKEKVKEKSELREQDKYRESSKKDPVDTPNVKTFHLPKDNEKSAATDGNLKKRKRFEMNGFLHDNEIRPNKLPRPSSSSHPFPENGRKLETCQTAIQFTSDRQGAANNHKVDDKEHKVNGIIQDQPSSAFSAKLSFTTVKANGNGEASTKPSHPDFKYLSQILTVPKMEEWSDFDDQEWLFSSDNLRLEKPKQQSSGVDEITQVWAEALRIESADVCALPYVIPY
ncbi:PREDICTED: DEAD-box ATP-dependent RNA helicase 42-like [Nelumbo nucifera]|uniref:DEAD-box ATP-dependent RNA helicase 42-like n=2 Tax=Nelumbo nucifera TaxID=4432 RepID=A0A1U8BBY7_NELNU|nr:PREDICTED: DEAD-box ATP-dependent RNA helicase 42-like [Nelumbo nucifera]XP_010274073.1 PREDICTED: DEAD-box ATP-dependent RNA helicase 42-like [Nelumbo nucifera]DAD37111.1 TPA_asm: hypothetical protein HUJ06_007752 [Nelumbo nucifera]